MNSSSTLRRSRLGPLVAAWVLVLPLAQGQVSEFEACLPIDRIFRIDGQVGEGPAARSGFRLWPGGVPWSQRNSVRFFRYQISVQPSLLTLAFLDESGGVIGEFRPKQRVICENGHWVLYWDSAHSTDGRRSYASYRERVGLDERGNLVLSRQTVVGESAIAAPSWDQVASIRAFFSAKEESR